MMRFIACMVCEYTTIYIHGTYSVCAVQCAYKVQVKIVRPASMCVSCVQLTKRKAEYRIASLIASAITSCAAAEHGSGRCDVRLKQQPPQKRDPAHDREAAAHEAPKGPLQWLLQRSRQAGLRGSPAHMVQVTPREIPKYLDTAQ